MLVVCLHTVFGYFIFQPLLKFLRQTPFGIHVYSGMATQLDEVDRTTH